MVPKVGRGRLLSVGVAWIALAALVGCASTSPGTATVEASGSAADPVTTPIAGGGPDYTALGFSSDGSECTLGEAAESFATGVPIHVVLEMSPALPIGGTVSVTVEKDGVELVDARQTLTMDEPTPCIYATLRELVAEPGHYRLSYTISPTTMPPVVGEFDVT